MTYSLKSEFLYTHNEQNEIVLVNLENEGDEFFKVSGKVTEIFVDIIENLLDIEALTLKYGDENKQKIEEFIDKMLELGVFGQEL
jgi:hypothetical protein